jgi:tetratricopeptide (TPR) repeat protein
MFLPQRTLRTTARTLLFGGLVLLAACSGGKAATNMSSFGDPEMGGRIPAGSDKRAAVMRVFMEATQARLGGQLAKAVQLYQQCLKLDPANAASMFELSKLAHQAQNFPQALDYAKRAVATDKENIWYRFLLADLYTQNRQFNEAASVYRDVLARWPERTEVHFELANVLAQGGQIDGAVKVLTDLEKRLGPNPELLMQQFNLLAGTGRYTEAEAVLKRAIDANPKDSQFQGMLAQLYDQQGDTAKALAQYQKAIAADPDNSMLRIALAEHYYGTGRMDDAYRELGEAFLDPELDIDAKMQVLIGFFEMTEHEGNDPNDRPDLIRRSYVLIDALQRAHPESGKPNTIHGDFLMRDGRLLEAREQFRMAASKEKDRYPIHFQLMQLDLQLGDYEALRTDAEECIAMFPTAPENHLYHGIALSQLKRYDEAIEALITGRDLVVDNPPLLAQFWTSLGDTYNAAKEYAKSDQAYERSLAIIPDNPGALNNFAYFLSLRGEQLEKAERMSRRSLELAPGEATYMDTYAWVLFRQKKYAEARSWIEKALSTGGENGEVVEHYGDILFELGDKAGAMEQWRKAKELGGASDLIGRKINEGIRVE